MKNKITRAKVGAVICSAEKNTDGSPVWIISEDGSISINAVLNECRSNSSAISA